jgi:hypothetical protein
MGMFSWLTSDGEESIANVYSGRETKTVYLLQPNGKPPIKESAYEGYGDFGNVDAYVWLAEQNAGPLNIDISQMEHEGKRDLGIHLAFHRTKEVVYPLKFSFNENAIYENLPAAKECPEQGFFYDDASGWL